LYRRSNGATMGALHGEVRMSRMFFVLAAVALLALGRPAASQTASPEATAAAKELVEAMRATDQLKVLMPMLMQQLKPAIVQGRPEVDRDYDAIVPQMLAAADARMGEFAGSIATIYAIHFTADELRQLTGFYRGPVGQKFLQIMPKIMQDSMAVGQKFGESIALDTRDRMIEELRKRGHKI
jgi:uncharacterized protein